MANRLLARDALQKPAKGTAVLARRASLRARLVHEAHEKAAVIARDGAHRCRLVPHCRERQLFETAHLNAKGMGGDHGVRTTRAAMVRCCLFHHRGEWSLHSGDLKVKALTAAGTDGPIAVYARFGGSGKWYLVGRETQVGVWERALR